MKDPFSELVPWYANKTLDPESAKRVASHLEGCAECRELLNTSLNLLDAGRDLRAEGEDTYPSQWMDHVHEGLLVKFADDPGALEGETRAWVEAHIAGCETCSADLTILRSLDGNTEAQLSEPSTRTWWATRNFRAALAAGLVLAVLAYPAWRGFTHDARMHELEMERGGLRSEVEDLLAQLGRGLDYDGIVVPIVGDSTRPANEPPLQVPVREDQPYVLVTLPSWDFVDETTYRVELVNEESRVVWTKDIVGKDLRRSAVKLGVSPLIVPSTTLPPDRYTLMLSRGDPAGFETEFAMPFEIVSVVD